MGRASLESGESFVTAQTFNGLTEFWLVHHNHHHHESFKNEIEGQKRERERRLACLGGSFIFLCYQSLKRASHLSSAHPIPAQLSFSHLEACSFNESPLKPLKVSPSLNVGSRRMKLKYFSFFFFFFS